MKKNFTILLVLSISAMTFLLTGCFSPWTGNTGNLTINLGEEPSQGNGRLVFESAEIPLLEYQITLRGPGGTVSKTLQGSGSASFQVSPGKWTVDVRAIGETPLAVLSDAVLSDNPFPTRMLRALGMVSVDVKGGAGVTVPVKMISATEVKNWVQLQYVLSNAAGREEIAVISNDMEAETNITITGNSGTRVTLMADHPVNITRSPSPINDAIFTVNNNYTLVLGKPDMTGTITIDGNKTLSVTSPLVLVSNGSLEMYNGVVLQNNNNFNTSQGGAVVLDSSGVSATFNMNGGIIRDNTAYNNGAAVYAAGSGALLTMRGGTITGNTASGNGGGVYVETGASFTMSGGTIASNKTGPSSSGGGVYVNSGAAFSKEKGGIIYGNDAGTNGNSAGVMGHAVYALVNSGTLLTLIRNSTLGVNDQLSTAVSGAESGWNQ